MDCLFWWIAPTIKWFDEHPGTAGWVQGLGALIAIGIAIYVPWRQERWRRNEKAAEARLRARNMSVAIYPELFEIRIHARHICRYLGKLIENPGVVTPKNVEEIKKLMVVDIPSFIGRYEKDFYILGEDAGDALQQAVALTNQYNRLVKRSPLKEVKNFLTLRGYLDAAIKVMNSALDAVAKVHDGGVEIVRHQEFLTPDEPADGTEFEPVKH